LGTDFLQIYRADGAGLQLKARSHENPNLDGFLLKNRAGVFERYLKSSSGKAFFKRRS
jgi:hypothetical protein